MSKKNSDIFSLFVIIALFAIIVLMGCKNRQLSQTNATLLQYAEQYAISDNQKQMLMNDVRLSLEITQQDLGNLIVTNEDGLDCNLKHVMSDNHWFFYFSEIHCNTCVNVVISELNKYHNNNVIFIGKYSSMIDLIKFKRINRIKNPIYNIAQDSTIFNNISVPCFLKLSQDGNIQTIFIPHKEMLEYSSEIIGSILVD